MKAAVYWFAFCFALLSAGLFCKMARPWIASAMLGAMVCICVGFCRVKR